MSPLFQVSGYLCERRQTLPHLRGQFCFLLLLFAVNKVLLLALSIMKTRDKKC